jgi:hypothetical protein
MELTPVEQSLVEHVGRREWLDLAGKGEAVDEPAMRSWGDSRTCRATVIRDILRGKLAADPDPHGLRLRGGRISGRLDLANLTTGVSLELRDCLLEEGVLALDANLTAGAALSELADSGVIAAFRSFRECRGVLCDRCLRGGVFAQAGVFAGWLS